jgi:methionyl-tRNA synthetase
VILTHISKTYLLEEVVDAYYTDANISSAIEAIMGCIVNMNRYFSKNEPWKLRKKKEELPRLQTIIYITLEGLRICSLLLTPIMPQSMSSVLDRLGVNNEERLFQHCKFGRKSGATIKTNPDFKAFVIPDINK